MVQDAVKCVNVTRHFHVIMWQVIAHVLLDGQVSIIVIIISFVCKYSISAAVINCNVWKYVCYLGIAI